MNIEQQDIINEIFPLIDNDKREKLIKAFNFHSYERIRTYEDALLYLGLKHDAHFDNLDDHLQAYCKLSVITKALNEGEVLDPMCEECRYYPYVHIEDNAGIGHSATHKVQNPTYAFFGSHTCFKSKELCIYCLNQFWPLWRDFFGYDKDLKLIIK